MSIYLKKLAWEESFQRSFEAINRVSLFPARVVGENQGQYIVNTSLREAVARIPGGLLQSFCNSEDYPTVGDWLALEPRAFFS